MLRLCYNGDMKKIAITECTMRDALAPYLVDKMLKLVRSVYGCETEMTLVLPLVSSSAGDASAPQCSGVYRVQSIAAVHGVAVTYGVTRELMDPLAFWVEDEQWNVRLPEGITDWHAHTQFAYCGRGIDFADAAEVAFKVGVEHQCFAEHGFALYFPSNALKFYWQSDRAFVEKIWRTPQRGRMVMYRALVEEARKVYGERVRFGMETDLFGGGQLCLAPEDEGFFDYLIGAIHEVEGINPKSASDAELEYAWQRDVERLIASPITILAHPFRYFPWYGRKIPRHLYRPVAKMLAQRGIAAEINHHANPFELAFFEMCLEENVQISLGTDAHITRNIADLRPHLKTLSELNLEISALKHL